MWSRFRIARDRIAQTICRKLKIFWECIVASIVTHFVVTKFTPLSMHVHASDELCELSFFLFWFPEGEV